MDGRLVESGTYQELKDRQGAFSEVLETFHCKQVDTHGGVKGLVYARFHNYFML